MRKLVAFVAICLALTSGADALAQNHGHPKLKKFAQIAGVGALTGGLGGIFLGSGLIHGAIFGAGSHLGFHAIHEKWKQRKRRSISSR